MDVEPNYVRITVKGKIFQMALNDEVRISDATSKRSQTTGHLLITMPKLSYDITSVKTIDTKTDSKKSGEFNNFQAHFAHFQRRTNLKQLFRYFLFENVTLIAHRNYWR